MVSRSCGEHSDNVLLPTRLVIGGDPDISRPSSCGMLRLPRLGNKGWCMLNISYNVLLTDHIQNIQYSSQYTDYSKIKSV